MALFALKCRKSVSTDRENYDFGNNYGTTTCAANTKEELFSMSKLADSSRQNVTPKDERIN